MENSLIVIIFIASIIYKIYTNYKKETEKAKQRNYKRKPNQTPAYTHGSIPEQKGNVTFYEDKASYSGQNDNFPDEVKKLIELKQQKQSITTSKVVETNTQERYPFDLRQAILQSAILERPYK